jgi:hypothetical protein
LTPSTSVIIPVFNRADLVARAVRSVLAQTLSVDEIIVVDDASTDGTAAAVDGITHPLVRLLRHPENRGASAARNTGIDAASADILAFLDSDDEWTPHRLERQLAESAHRGLIACSFEVRTAGRSIRAAPGCFRGADPHTRLLRLRGGPLTASCLMLDRRAGAGELRFDVGLPALEDLDLAIRATESLELAHLDEVLVIKHSGRADRLYTPATELEARLRLLEIHMCELAADGPALGAHHLAIARAGAAQGAGPLDELVSHHLDAAVAAWPSAPARAARTAWQLGGGDGLRLACRAWWFLAEDPAGRIRSRLPGSLRAAARR